MQIAFVVYPGMTALDVVGPYEILRLLPDVRVRFVWREAGPVVTDSGVLVLGATHTFDETPSPDVVVVGGSSAAFAGSARDEDLRRWLRRVHPTTQWTVSVCTGSLILAGAGLLDGRRATSHWSTLPVLAGRGAHAVGDERVVRSGKIVSGAGVSAGLDVALWLAGQIAGDTVARAIQLAVEYDPQPPYDSGSTAKADPDVKRAVAGLVGREAVELVVNDPGVLPRELSASGALLWEGVLQRARRRRSVRRRRPRT